MFEYLPGILSDESEYQGDEENESYEKKNRGTPAPVIVRLILGIIILIGLFLSGLYSRESAERVKDETKELAGSKTEADKYADTIAEEILYIFGEQRE